jgi:putative membrane-bound dehydrogenase-like protein
MEDRSRHVARAKVSLVALMLLLAAGGEPAGSAEGERAAGPMGGVETARRMGLPAGFRATLFAGEPDVVEPIAFTIDPRGRLWVVESMAYPKWSPSGPGKDRVVIFEDSRGTGTFDKRTVFLETGRNLTGIELGFGGVWLLSAPQLLFIPIKEDRPAGEPVVKLEGWATEIQHNIVSNLTWGMDGWLYGCHGITTKSRVGTPATPVEQRQTLDCSVWRYHPVQERFEVVAWGSTNPWGLDYDRYGNWYISNCVIDHLFHVVPNAHYRRMFGNDLNPHIYELLPGCADHQHWGGGSWQEGGRVDTHYGGHAHSGLMVYQGDNWPEEYRGDLYLLSIHGKRMNRERPEYRGAEVVARHQPDLLRCPDSWFMGVQCKYGPDGGVYVIDWNDTGECHSYVNTQKATGRIYKITYGESKRWREDLATWSEVKLAGLITHPNEWLVRTARRLLMERSVKTPLSKEARDVLLNAFDPAQPTGLRLRALWTMHACGVDPTPAFEHAWERDEHVQAWLLRLWYDMPRKFRVPGRVFMQGENRPVVLRTLASLLPRMDAAARKVVALGLLNKELDRDPYLPALVWAGIEPEVTGTSPVVAEYLHQARHPQVLEWMARKLTGQGEAGMHHLAAWLRDDAGKQAAMLTGIEKAVEGRKLQRTPGWDGVLAAVGDERLRSRRLALAARLGDGEAIRQLRVWLRDERQPVAQRQGALAALLAAGPSDLVGDLLELLSEEALRLAVIRGLARFEDTRIAKRLIEVYPSVSVAEKQEVQTTLVARAVTSRAFLDALEAGKIPGTDVLTPTVVSLRQFKEEELRERVKKRWGAPNTTPAALRERIARYRNELSADVLRQADVVNGRVLFDRHCATCHKLFGEGNAIGPELTGAQRMNLDYVLENIVNPNAIVPGEYKMKTAVLASGRVVTGVVVQETAELVTMQTPTERLTVPRSEIEALRDSHQSLMPEGLLEGLRAEEVRDLIGYLASPRQVRGR